MAGGVSLCIRGEVGFRAVVRKRGKSEPRPGNKSVIFTINKLLLLLSYYRISINVFSDFIFRATIAETTDEKLLTIIQRQVQVDIGLFEHH